MVNTTYLVWSQGEMIGRVGLHNDKAFFRAEKEGHKSPRSIVERIAATQRMTLEQVVQELPQYFSPFHRVQIERIE